MSEIVKELEEDFNNQVYNLVEFNDKNTILIDFANKSIIIMFLNQITICLESYGKDIAIKMINLNHPYIIFKGIEYIEKIILDFEEDTDNIPDDKKKEKKEIENLKKVKTLLLEYINN